MNIFWNPDFAGKLSTELRGLFIFPKGHCIITWHWGIASSRCSTTAKNSKSFASQNCRNVQSTGGYHSLWLLPFISLSLVWHLFQISENQIVALRACISLDKFDKNRLDWWLGKRPDSHLTNYCLVDFLQVPSLFDRQGAKFFAVALLVVSRTWISDRIASLNGMFIWDVCAGSWRSFPFYVYSVFTGTSVKYVLEQDKAAFIRLTGISILQSAANSFVAPTLRYDLVTE